MSSNNENEPIQPTLNKGGVIGSAEERALEYLKITYWGFKNYQYFTALEIGDINNFENMERQPVSVSYYPYTYKGGKTYHQLFIDRVEGYLGSCVPWKRHY